MKRKAMIGACMVAAALVAGVVAFVPAQAQFLKKLEQEVLGGGTNQGLMPGQSQFVGNVSLPPGNYLMQNTQTGQSFYVQVSNGQMYLSQGVTPPTVPGGAAGFTPGGNWSGPGYNGGINGGAYGTQIPGQQSNGLGGMVKNGLGNFLKNELMPGQQQQVPVQQGY